MMRALLVEDHGDTREWMCGLLEEAFPDIAVTSADSIAAARQALQEIRISLAVIDINLPDGSGVDFVAEIAQAQPDAYRVVATIFDDDDHIFSALKAGAQGYLLKEQATERLVAQLRRITQGEPPISPAIARRMLRHFQAPKPAHKTPSVKLTEREQDVLRLVAKSYSRAEIARLLNITPNTAAGYIKSLYQKLNISSRAEAALEAARLGYLDIDCR